MRTPRPRRAFTFVEMLIVVGIIGTLIGMLVIGVTLALRRAVHAGQVSDFQTIAAAIDLYSSDFKSIPRTDFTSLDSRIGNDTLTRALLAPGPAVASSWAAGNSYSAGDWVNDAGAYYQCNVANTSNEPKSSPTLWTYQCNQNNPADGHDGFGCGRTDGGGGAYGPYIRPDNFKVTCISADGDYWHLMDRWGTPIGYYCARGVRSTRDISTPQVNLPIRVPGTYCDETYTGNPYPNLPTVINMWEYSENQTFTGAFGGNLQKFRAMLGDLNNDGAINNGETAGAMSTYLLWSAGPDKKFGPNFAPASGFYKSTDVSGCDDIVYSDQN